MTKAKLYPSTPVKSAEADPFAVGGYVAHDQDPVVFLAAEYDRIGSIWEAAQDEAELANAPDAQALQVAADAVLARLRETEIRILTTPARTRAGLQEQIRRARNRLRGNEVSEAEVEAIFGAIGTGIDQMTG